MFKRLSNWFKGKRKPEMVTIWGIRSVPWGASDVPGYPKGELVALREVPRSSLPAPSRNESIVPNPPRRLTQNGLATDPKSVAKRHRAWIVENLPDEAMFGG
jgi:hypothetical protein